MRVLIVYLKKTSFVQRDIDLLAKPFMVTGFQFTLHLSRLWSLVKQLRRHDVLYVWFASYHTFITFRLAQWLKKRTVVVVGGYDASDIPGYGMFNGWLKQWIVKDVYKHADMIIPVDSSLKKVIVRYLPGVRDRITVIPTGYDSDYFTLSGKKKKQVLMVCTVDSVNVWRKGIITFIATARSMPDVPFFLIGAKKIDLDYPKNMTVTGWVDDATLLRFYQESKVFALLSRYEGLPNVLCEAMLCGCIPVTTGVCGIPHAQGDKGFYVPYANVKATVEAVTKALSEDISPEMIRDHVKERFTLKKRQQALERLLL